MKKLFLIFLLLPLLSCEEVVEVELEQSTPRLVIEASLLWTEEEENETQYIRLTTTAPYFDEEIPPAEGAMVSVFAPDGTEYNFEESDPGIYINNSISPSLDGEFEMVIRYNGQEYQATEKYITTPQLEEVVQVDGRGFSGDETEFRLFYTDPAEEDNFYLFRFFHDELALQIYDDEFTNGNRSFAFFSDGDVDTGDKVEFEIQGISKRFYEYLYILRSQSGTAGGPFQTQPTDVRGNIINVTNPENFAFGYFRLSETDFLTYTVE
ncbi:DUF4249 family protein [Salinimicrobium catena]|uniref:DUF4249 family protein n=1 Tax=Salinimicrobium catena TaxID=390640 RepID=UPI002FE45CA5